MDVWMDCDERSVKDRAQLLELSQLLLTAQIVIHRRKVNLALLLRLRVLDQNSNGDWRTTALSKNVAAFLLALHPGATGIPFQMIDVDRAKLLLEATTNTAGGSRLNPSRIGDKCYDSALSQVVGGPTKCLNV